MLSTTSMFTIVARACCMLFAAASPRDAGAVANAPQPPPAARAAAPGAPVDALAQDGDIIFHTSQSSQSLAVQIVTGSQYSHMGIIYVKSGQCFVFEAAHTVKLTPLNEWIQRGLDGHFVLKRLKNRNKVLAPETLTRMKEVGNRFNNKPYDLFFEWSDDRIYCSELVWKIYKEGAGIAIGQLQRVRDFNLSHPLVQKKKKERFGDKVPDDGPAISPARMFDSDLLEVVCAR